MGLLVSVARGRGWEVMLLMARSRGDGDDNDNDNDGDGDGEERAELGEASLWKRWRGGTEGGAIFRTSASLRMSARHARETARLFLTPLSTPTSAGDDDATLTFSLGDDALPSNSSTLLGPDEETSKVYL